MTPDPLGLAGANLKNPGSWNRYAYVGGDPINFTDRHGTHRECVGPEDDLTCSDEPDNPCDEDPFMIGCGLGGGRPSGGGGGNPGSGGGGSYDPNPCSWANLSQAQQGMLNAPMWTTASKEAQQEFMDVSLDAAAIGVPLDGLTISTVTIAGQNGAAQTEVNFTGNTANLVKWLDTSGVFTSNQQDPLVGAPHAGYTGNYRQNTLTWSMQINTNGGGAQIDIDPYNPAYGLAGLLGHGLFQVIPNLLTGGDTNPFRTRSALQQGQRANMGAPCTGN